MNIHGPALKALNLLSDAGFEAYVVGGCVRDSLLLKEPSDWDITTNALPEETKKVFSEYRIAETGIKHGTVTVIIDGEPFEVTTYRVDGDYPDNRHPESVTFTRNLYDDLARRDFTVNAMACGIDGKIVDAFSGYDDLQARLIRCVGDPRVRFSEDALRIMRALRFSAALDFDIEPETAEAIHEKRGLLKNIAAERITDELMTFLCGKGERVTKLLIEYRDVFAVIIPELEPCFDFDQKNIHHIYDIYTHIAYSVGGAEPLPDVRLALLLHDIGKPDCFFTDDEGVGHFYGHAERSAEIAQTALSRLRLSSQMSENVLTLVRYHDYPVEPSEKIIRRRLNKFGPELFKKLMLVKAGDNFAHNTDLRDYSGLINEIMNMAENLENDCFTLSDLKVGGDDIKELGLEGPAIGKVLNRLLEEVMDEELENDHDKLIERAKTLGTEED